MFAWCSSESSSNGKRHCSRIVPDVIADAAVRICRYQDRGLPFCYVGFFDGMEEGTLRANVIEARINDVSVRYERMKPGEESENEVYGVGEVVPAEKIIGAAGFKVRARMRKLEALGSYVQLRIFVTLRLFAGWVIFRDVVGWFGRKCMSGMGDGGQAALFTGYLRAIDSMSLDSSIPVKQEDASGCMHLPTWYKEVEIIGGV